MSADAWDECPRCQVKVEADRTRKITRADQAYGNVSKDERERRWRRI